MADFLRIRQSVVIFATTALFAISAQADAPVAPEKLDLQQVFTLVETRNGNVLAGGEGVKAEEQGVRQSRAALMPHLDGGASQGRSKVFYDFGGADLMPVQGNSFAAAFSASVSLFDADNISGYRAAKIDARMAAWMQEATVQDACARAAQLYFLYQRNLSAMKVTQNSIDLDQVLLDRATQRRKAEAATDLDVTRAQAALARDRQTLLVQQTALDQTRLALQDMIGMKPEERFELAAVDTVATDFTAVPHWEFVLAERPEYKAATAALDRYKVEENAAKWGRYPKVSAMGEVGHASRLPGDGDGGTEWGVALTAKVPVLDGGELDARRTRARVLQRRQDYVIRQLSDDIRSAYELSLAEVSQRWDELPLARENVRLAQLELQYSRQRFEAGVNDNSDVVQAQVKLAAANDSLVDAVYRYQLARIDLARVLGQVQARLSK